MKILIAIIVLMVTSAAHAGKADKVDAAGAYAAMQTETDLAAQGLKWCLKLVNAEATLILYFRQGKEKVPVNKRLGSMVLRVTDYMEQLPQSLSRQELVDAGWARCTSIDSEH